jgi:hypothetical protein
MMTQTTELFETTDLKLAAFLFAKEVQLDGLRWIGDRQAVFVFSKPENEILSAWLLEEGKFIKKYEQARNYLRDKLEGK